jgi:hypothetical protein
VVRDTDDRGRSINIWIKRSFQRMRREKTEMEGHSLRNNGDKYPRIRER